ncbi:MAG: glucose-6-phosphate dehydrogenase [Alphaproteobacteria bacterium]|nr:glucose-6-phosphate dehydrogenase [Alphaproteobacteria bacterium]
MAQAPSVPAFDLVVFGGNGDLALRKLMPALYHRERDGQLEPGTRIIATARSALDRDSYRALIEARARPHIAEREFDGEVWRRFLDRLDYLRLDAADASQPGWMGLHERLDPSVEKVRIFYLATSPELFGPICRSLKGSGLVTAAARVVVEKPIGHDPASAREINDQVGLVFAEERIFRIDHYLGKETVQNLMALRFANALFEPLWHRGEIDHVQITVAESIGVEGRGAYYDRSGALRDMVQNHLLQLLCLVAMEPPVAFSADAVRDEKLKVLQALRPVTGADVARETVRGQYRAGAVQGQAVPGYLEEIGGGPSATETYVAIRAALDNWRWAGVPFYLRTGKRLQERSSEIVIQFRHVPHLIFPTAEGDVAPNRLVIRLQPDEGIRLHMMAKVPGPGGMRLKPASLNLSFAEAFNTRYPDAYERLLMDVVRGNPTLFMRRDEVEAAWAWTGPILDSWGQTQDEPKPYIAGGWGPTAAATLVGRDGRAWHEDMR